jgi:hypothetical protein
MLPNLAASLSPVLSESTFEPFSINGSYSITLPNSDGKLVIATVNTQYWAIENDFVDDCEFGKVPNPGSEIFSWLNEVLIKARESKSRVILIGHIPPTSEGRSNYKPQCYAQFLKLIDAHSSVILSMHCGHVNYDRVSFIARKEKSQEVQIVEVEQLVDKNQEARDGESDWTFLVPIYTVPSIVPVRNPGIRVFKFDLNQMQWIGWKQYVLDLQQANRAAAKKAHHRIQFQLEYSTWKEYGLHNLTIASWQAMQFNTEFSKKYNHFKEVLGPL